MLTVKQKDLLDFINDFAYFDTTNAIGKFQQDTFNYSLGRISLTQKNYKEACNL
mgnify:CR=1 FL=1